MLGAVAWFWSLNTLEIYAPGCTVNTLENEATSVPARMYHEYISLLRNVETRCPDNYQVVP